MGIRQSPSHCSSQNLSFNTLIMDSFLLLTSILVLSLSKIICEPNPQTGFRSLEYVLFRRLRTFPPSSGPLLYMGLSWVPLRKSSLWSSSTRFESPITLKCLTPIWPWLARSDRLHILPCCLNRKILI